MNEILCFFLLLIGSVQANITKTECISSEVVALRCIFPKNLNTTRTDFTVYFHSADGKADLLVDCAWVGDQLHCIEQVGFKCKWPVSDVADISVPTRFLRFSGTYSCIPEGSSSENTISCKFSENQSERQQEKSQDEHQREGDLKQHGDKGAGSSTEETLGIVFGVVALVLLATVGVVMYKKFLNKNKNIRKSNRTAQHDEYCSFLLTENKRKIEETKYLAPPFPLVSSRQRSSSLRKQFEDDNNLEITRTIVNEKRKQRSDTL
ncbi:uncharacterized protein LOC112567917 isoform X3 [Pomacea canaliculata]|nr:uncharacterized protein LOC112567917 isoform X3 [Pomacea canaliculata]